MKVKSNKSVSKPKLYRHSTSYYRKLHIYLNQNVPDCTENKNRMSILKQMFFYMFYRINKF